MNIGTRLLLFYYIGVNLLGFCLYGMDKRKAVLGKWRIPERVLLGIACLGGAFGAWFGMQIFRHKTKHWKFRILVPLFLILHIMVLMFCI